MKKKNRNRKAVAIYHRMRADEDLRKTVDILVRLVKKAQKVKGNAPRFLYLDIDGHRNNVGGWDCDAFDVQRFIIESLGDFLTEIGVPLLDGRVRTKKQEPIPEDLEIRYILDDGFPSLN